MTPRLAYTAFMLLSIAVFFLTRRLQPALPALVAVPRWKRAIIALAAFIGAGLGAKLPFALGIAEGWEGRTGWFSDGKTLVTGLIGAYLAVEIAKRFLDIHIKTGDSFALPLALALAVGRCGCFCNGCCHGTPTTLPWAVDFGDGIPRHPTQIYESLFHLIMAAVLIVLFTRHALPHHRLQLYLIAYAVYRFATEFIRPEPIWYLGLTFYQWSSIALAATLVCQWYVEAREAHLRRRAIPLSTPLEQPI